MENGGGAMPWNALGGGAGRGGIQGTAGGASGVIPGTGNPAAASGVESGTVGTGRMGMGGKTSIISSSELLSLRALGLRLKTAMLGGRLSDISGACFLISCLSSFSFASDEERFRLRDLMLAKYID